MSIDFFSPEKDNSRRDYDVRRSLTSKSLSGLKTIVSRNVSMNNQPDRRNQPMKSSKNENFYRRRIENSVPIVSLVPIDISTFSQLTISDDLETSSRTNHRRMSRNVQQRHSTIVPARGSSNFDCCDESQSSSLTPTEENLVQSSERSKYFQRVTKINEIMLNISRRLTENIDLSKQCLPLVDTHCHFDLIFSRLRIKHNDLTKYFEDYREFYPSKFDFQLAIQVFWRPNHLTEKNWNFQFSKYLNDHRVYGSCGVHPHWSSLWTDRTLSDLERCLKHEKVVALGEIGLDFGRKNVCEIDVQKRAFEAQLDLAVKIGKPIVIHSRDAYKESFELMKKHLDSNHKIHLHCFVGNLDDIDMFTSYFTEIKFGFTPLISRSNFLDPVLQQLELTQILSETDSPYFSPAEFSELSDFAHPGMVYSVVEKISELRNLSILDVAQQLRQNARHIYGV